MSPPTATVTSRRDAAQRRTAVRRRRGMLAGSAVLIGVIAVVLAMPLFQKAVTELALPLAHDDIIRQQAADKHLPPELIAAVIYAETKFDPRTSPAGAEGLMQILPQTAEFLARRSGATNFTTADLATPQVNIAYGSYYLRYLIDQFGGNTVLGLAAYNGGEANVNHWLAEARADHRRFIIADISFPETRAYVRKVLQAETDYRSTYASRLGY